MLKNKIKQLPPHTKEKWTKGYKFFDYLMLDSLYDKYEIMHNGGNLNISPRLNMFINELILNQDPAKKQKILKKPVYFAELNGNVYLLEPEYPDERVPIKFRCVERIISKHEVAS
jgi:hypothetical protein